ncbi:MAG: UPF0149 family protein, partial [Gammaproteobacteria bacterium]|nr:UPF0149 family protein [Gammaproteobacteria bacterium]
MNFTADPEFEQIDQALERATAAAAAAEGHGMLCGMLCAAGHVDRGDWIEQVLQEAEAGDLLAGECRQALSSLYDFTVRRLNDSGMDFQLLLPADDQPLAARVQALGEWCEGFLAGLGLGGMTAGAALPDDVREIMSDLVEIAKISLKVHEGEEQDEQDYAEV